jgi:hypothetical protein
MGSRCPGQLVPTMVTGVWAASVIQRPEVLRGRLNARALVARVKSGRREGRCMVEVDAVVELSSGRYWFDSGRYLVDHI